MNTEIKSLTGIRGIAAMWVVILHYRHAISHDKESFIIKLITNGFVAVDIFFLLSAFVMCLAYSDEFIKRISIPSYRVFLKKRFARIYPAYFFWMFLSLLIFEFLRFQFDYAKLLTNLLLIQNLFNKVEISFIFWSLCAEWILYMIFPFLYFFLQKNKHSYVRVFLILFCLAAIYILPSIGNYIIDLDKGVIIMYQKEDISVIIGLNSIARCFFSYVIGINLFLLIKDYNPISYFLTRVLKYIAILGIFVSSFWGKSAETYVLILICSIILISILYLEKEKVGFILSSKFIYFLGQISYSIYLSHMFILTFLSHVVRKLFPLEYDKSLQLCPVILSLILLIPVSYLSYRFIELKIGSALKSKLLVSREFEKKLRHYV